MKEMIQQNKVMEYITAKTKRIKGTAQVKMNVLLNNMNREKQNLLWWEK
jgi:hypothetical protein